MAVIPETILQRTIIQGFRALRKDSRMLDVIFANMHQDQLAAIKQFILETSIDFSINYPRKDLRVPAIVLILKNETESQGFLGDSMGDGSSPFVPGPEFELSLLGGTAASTSNRRGLPRKIAGPLLVQEQQGPFTIAFQEDQLTLVQEIQSDPSIGSLQLYVVDGAGKGQVYNVLRIRNDSLDIDGSFEINLDSTSVIDLRIPKDPEMADGEPSKVYDPTINLIRRGALYEVSYHLHVLCGQQDQVIYLYSILKALLLSQRVYLESQGIQVMKIGGSDFAPRSEYLPDEIFQRQMTLTFTYPFDFIDEQETFNHLQLQLAIEEDSGCGCGSSSVLISKTIDLTE